MSDTSVRTPILITGCQRSGTTLMNLILDSHPKIWGIDEGMFDLTKIYMYLSMPRPEPFVSFKLPRYAHLKPFVAMLPGCRVLWCIRDPMDVVWSMVKLTIEFGGLKAPWAIHPDGGWHEIESSYWALDETQKAALKDPMAAFDEIKQMLTDTVRSDQKVQKISRQHTVFAAALCWRIKNELPSLYKNGGIPFHVIRYDDLVTDPATAMAKVLDFTGAGWSDEVLMHHRLHQGMSIGNTSNTRPIDQSSLGSGKRHLSQEEQEIVKRVCAATARAWNYTLE